MEKIKNEKPIIVAEIVGKYIGGGVEAEVAVKLLRGVYIC